MRHVLEAAVRELKLDPVRPVRVWTQGLVVELRVVRSELGGVVVSPWALQEPPSPAEGLQRLGRLMASARALSEHRWGGRDA